MSETPASMASPTVSIVVPVRNEAGNIAPLIAEIVAALGTRPRFEIIYVNDGSSDRTEFELTLLMASRPWLRQVKHAASCGQSAAVRTGVLHAKDVLAATVKNSFHRAGLLWQRRFDPLPPPGQAGRSRSAQPAFSEP